MNRILFEGQAPVYRLDPGDERLVHVRGTLRLREGDTFEVGVLNGPTGKARISVLKPDWMEIEVEWGSIPPEPPPIHLLVGMCRPATVRKILTTAPTLGVRRISFAPAGRSDPAYGRSRLWSSGEWRTRLVEGVEQAYDTWLPQVDRWESLPAAIASIPGPETRLALDVHEGQRPLSSLNLPAGEPVCLAVGPERGWNSNDRKLLRENGFLPVSLHDRILRVETAVLVGLTLLLVRMGRL